MTVTDHGQPTGTRPPSNPAEQDRGEDWLVSDQLAPAADGQLAPLYRAAASGGLSLPFCGRCGQALELDQTICDRCWSTDQAWRPVDRSGVVHAVTMVHRIEAGLIKVSSPYPVIDVELSSGHRLVLATTAPMATAPGIGDPVTIGFRTIGKVTVPAVLATPSSS
jgi:uncharacterized protein